MSLVVDASFAGAWLLPTKKSLRADEVLRQSLGEQELLQAIPAVFYDHTTALTRSRLDSSLMKAARRLGLP